MSEFILSWGLFCEFKGRFLRGIRRRGTGQHTKIRDPQYTTPNSRIP